MKPLISFQLTCLAAIWWPCITSVAQSSFTMHPALPQHDENQYQEVVKRTAESAFLPNILVIMIDDARYDMFAPNGGPSFFHTPAINRIANEGVNFKYAAVTTALCTPSRASIYTGLYAHHHGAISNTTSPKPGLTYISSILQNAGYFTGFVGKWLLTYQIPDRPVGFDYWAVTDSFGHTNPAVIFNDSSIVTYTENDPVVFTNLALDFLRNKVPAEKPWLLFLFHRVPHLPYEPLPEDETLYQDSTISFTDNFYKYKKNFPSFLYPEHEYEGDSTDLDQDIRDYYETCYGAEKSVDSLLHYLDTENVLDNTLVIFTSDNGYLLGEHYLIHKILAYDESIRVPLFIRYPAWFNAGTIVDNEFAANIDIAPTILEAAGIPDTFHMDGVSLRKLATGEIHRKDFFYEKYSLNGTNWEAVRSFNYKYIYSYCKNTTEEFFDLTLDPKENYNLLLDPSYASLIQEFRVKRDSFRIATNDTIFPDSGKCSLNTLFYADADGDGYGNLLVELDDDIVPPGYVVDDSDCNDANAGIHPGSPDVCNAIDDNCNGVTDENAIVASVTPTGAVATCSGIAITLSANTGAGISYQWKKGSNNIAGATNSTYNTSKAGSYKVTESNSFNCSSTSLATSVSVNSNPVATTPLGNLDICVTGSVMLQANSGSGLLYQWKKGSQNVAGATNQTYTATKAATYKVIVTNSNGCIKTSAGTKVTKSCREENVSTNDKTSFRLSLAPNPATSSIYVAYMGKQPCDVQFIIYDLTGKAVFTEVKKEEDGTIINCEFDVSDFIPGLYLLQASTGSDVSNIKFVVEK